MQGELRWGKQHSGIFNSKYKESHGTEKKTLYKDMCVILLYIYKINK